MRYEGGDQKIANKNVDLAHRASGFQRQAGRFKGDVETQLQAHAAGKHPAVEIARVAQPVAIEPNNREQSAGHGRDQQTLSKVAIQKSRQARTASADRTARRAPPRRPHVARPHVFQPHVARQTQPSLFLHQTPYRLLLLPAACINLARRLFSPYP